jgi:copper resistance protein B
LRLRYEIRRRFAPYFGIAYERSFGDTAARHDTHAVAGLRAWF